MGDGGSDLEALERDGDMAFWNAYLPPTKSNTGLTADPADPGISGLKSLVQSVKGEAERNAIATALDQARWNRKAAARLLKVSYRTLLYKIEQYHMSPPPSHFSGYGNGGSSRERHFHRG
jgi:DNA-binding NtrC family response regulator